MIPRINVITLGVADLPRSIRFYRDGLKFPTDAKDDAPIAHFRTVGTWFGVYPLAKLAEDIGPNVIPRPGFSGITLAYCVERKEDVAEVLEFAQRAGGRIVKEAQDVFWGGHSGYFADPDGYHWEVAWAPNWKFDANGHFT